LSAPRYPPGLPFLILPSAGAPGEIKDEGAACGGSQGGMAVWGGRRFVGAIEYSHQRYTADPTTGEQAARTPAGVP